MPNIWQRGERKKKKGNIEWGDGGRKGKEREGKRRFFFPFFFFFFFFCFVINFKLWMERWGGLYGDVTAQNGEWKKHNKERKKKEGKWLIFMCLAYPAFSFSFL